MKKYKYISFCGTILLIFCYGCQFYDIEDDDFAKIYKEKMKKHFNQADSIVNEMFVINNNLSDIPSVPDNFMPWWNSEVDKDMLSDKNLTPMSLEDFYISALKHSSQIKVFSDIPIIRETGITEAEGHFDIRTFLEGKYTNGRVPVRSFTDSLSNKVLHTESLEASTGLKRNLETGGEISLTQGLGWIKDDAEYRNPNPQTHAYATISLVQPLLKGAGFTYNLAAIRIAKIDSEVAMNEFIRQAETHLMEVTKAYWSIYLTRAAYLQKKRLLEDTEKIFEQLENRKDIDAVENQIVRIRAALTSRKAEMIRSEMAIRNAEDRIKALVNDPELYKSSSLEIIPASMPTVQFINIDPKVFAMKALNHRPEVNQAFGQLRAMAIRQNMAKNEMLPQLNAILEVGFDGLERNALVDRAIEEQWKHPTFSAGFSLEFPIQNREARARYMRRKLEVRQQLSQITTTLETILLEVKVAIREVKTTFKEVQASYAAMHAAQEDLRVLKERWGLKESKEAGSGGSTYLEFLLDSQERLRAAEYTLLKNIVAQNVAKTNLQRVQGTLLQYENIEIKRSPAKDDLDELTLKKKVVDGTSNDADTKNSKIIKKPDVAQTTDTPELEKYKKMIGPSLEGSEDNNTKTVDENTEIINNPIENK